MTLSISWSTDSETTDGGETTISSAFHVLEFDAALSIDHEAESEITDHVVENRAAISDHKRPKPRTVEIEGVITNTPLSAPPLSGFATRSVTATIEKGTGPAKAAVLAFEESFDRIRDVEATLERLRSEAIDLTVETSVRTYDNVQLISYRIPQNGAEEAVEIKLTLREVFRAETATADAPAPREPRGAARTETAAEPEAEETDDGDDSLLTQVIELINF